jgi:hypothetical protein
MLTSTPSRQRLVVSSSAAFGGASAALFTTRSQRPNAS